MSDLIFCNSTQANIPFSSTDARLAVVVYGSKAKITMNFADSASFGRNFDGLKNKIKQIQRIEGRTTNTAEALRVAHTLFLRSGRYET